MQIVWSDKLPHVNQSARGHDMLNREENPLTTLDKWLDVSWHTKTAFELNSMLTQNWAHDKCSVSCTCKCNESKMIEIMRDR